MAFSLWFWEDGRPRDRHVRRSGEDYLPPFLRLLPQGLAWPKDIGRGNEDSTLVKVCRGLVGIWGYVDGRAADLLERESDPRATTVVDLPTPPWPPKTQDGLLDWWERAWGLPDPCFPKATTIGERQKMLVLYMTWLGSQSRAYYTWLMEWLGFTIDIKEFAPFMAGVSNVGETRPTKPELDVHGNPTGELLIDTSKNYRWYIGPPEMRFVWSANVGTRSVTWFRAAAGQAGVDPHCRLGAPEDLQCLLNRWKPAHTDLVLDFSAQAVGPMYGTP